MRTYAVPIALLAVMVIIGLIGMLIVSLLGLLDGNAGVYAGAGAVMLLAVAALILESRGGQ